ncbi:RDD family protein [Lactococcus sp.]|uniref:RDD family protein n=1 Tax=Lactococcus sp. TaxID=44273 RepID=UPI0035B37F74
MKKLLFIQRVLATVIDLIIVYLPFTLLVQLMVTGNQLGSLKGLLPALLFVFYNMISEQAFHGKTIGKYFAKLKVKTKSQTLMEIGQRELAKVLYFLPFIWWAFILVSLICYMVKGKFLHDLIGRSEVDFDGQSN